MSLLRMLYVEVEIMFRSHENLCSNCSLFAGCLGLTESLPLLLLNGCKISKRTSCQAFLVELDLCIL